ncbi:UNVERIFIED_CONTAM: hypothetical protein Sangu_0225400 [Sesamum angustifolium]|uniref:Tf2-1-like SH3-like domain-containing protein n=1 Tax=Sesamum angustifolium TaxID=2727405 RepID=A0AAW2RQ58_9LAMI
MKSQADKHRQDCHFAVGDLVFLLLHPYRQHSGHRRTLEKLSRCFYGLFRILHRIGPVAYELDLPVDARIHPVFHISLLKPFCGDPPSTRGSLPIEVLGPSDPCQPFRILRTRDDCLLVQWEDEDEIKASWISLEDFELKFLNFSLEVNAGLDDPSNDTGWAKGSLSDQDGVIGLPAISQNGPGVMGLPSGTGLRF